MAGLDLVYYITEGVDHSEYTLGIFLDLSKAFDTVNHDIIIINNYIIMGLEVLLTVGLKVLSNRKQLVSINGCNSSYGNVSCGVPQCSIL